MSRERPRFPVGNGHPSHALDWNLSRDEFVASVNPAAFPTKSFLGVVVFLVLLFFGLKYYWEEFAWPIFGCVAGFTFIVCGITWLHCGDEKELGPVFVYDEKSGLVSTPRLHQTFRKEEIESLQIVVDSRGEDCSAELQVIAKVSNIYSVVCVIETSNCSRLKRLGIHLSKELPFKVWLVEIPYNKQKPIKEQVLS